MEAKLKSRGKENALANGDSNENDEERAKYAADALLKEAASILGDAVELLRGRAGFASRSPGHSLHVLKGGLVQ